MYFCKIFALFLYISVPLFTVECVGTNSHGGSGNGRGTGGGAGTTKQASGGSANLSGTSTSEGGTSEGASGDGSGTPARKQVPESPLDLSALSSTPDNGFFHEYNLDDWKIKWYRSFVGKNFNKLKLGNTDLWPEEVTKQSIFELLVFNKGEKYLIAVTALKPEGYLSTQFVHYQPNASDPSNSKSEMLQAEEFYTKFQQNLDSKFVEPFPDRLPKDVVYQKFRCVKAKSSNPSAGPDLDIV
ncbi:hypothetical protein TOT_030000508 [Theileria orientalis strain Shintoku]|uniref:Uncharacterized protein n=1 Tax=Theileria orientalis strain Shintoku TaxID=869250 RepID=J4D981_THEOR|nr:hypothetical protein TOT_030000508 [Theileria orientalis strain Shintoku]PVC51805.1 hypothetical protein MACL_00001270 [Theileria orientalis]BAM41245.1 hypothetical protein TOT_030000508 [Theileria orientalis strain Shintoku]|eukprot:XP_009691546.1 hypothetical protein TOT_030000508 [Theileria orientalis strain Shintoku]